MPHLSFRINFFLITELIFDGVSVGESSRKGLAETRLRALGGSRAFESWIPFPSQGVQEERCLECLRCPLAAPGIYAWTDDLNAKAQQNEKERASPS